MAAVAAATAGALVAFTLPKVASLIGHRNVQSLHSELQSIEAALRDYANSGNSTNHSARAWIEKIKHLADKIEYRIDLYTVEVESRGLEAGFFRRIAQGSKKQAITHGWFAWKIRKLHQKAKKIHERHIRYKEEWKSDGPSSSPAVPAAPQMHFQPNLVVGIDKPVNELLNLLAATRRESGSERKLKVISIVGYGGIGKTLLADRVYSHRDVCAQFPVRARVEAACKGAAEVVQEILQQLSNITNNVVPQTDVKGKGIHKGKQRDTEVVDDEIHEVVGSTSNIKQLLSFGLQLKKILKNTRYLIVIDDMQMEELCDLIPHFPSADGVDSRIIVTTTIQSVAKRCSYDNDLGCLYKLNTLSDEDSEALFFHIFGRCSPERRRELDSSALLKKCDGLPLALVCTARFLKGKKLEKKSCNEALRKVCGSEQSAYTLQRMRGQLFSNYESLYNLGLQDLLLYFCMFARDQPVRRRALIRRWLAEDLITVPLDAGPDGNSWDVALDKLEALIDRNIIQPVEVSTNGDAKRCQPPGMMLEYISRKSMTQHFTLFCGEKAQEQEQGGNRVRRLSLYPGTSAANLPKDLSYLRTLVVFPGRETANYEAPLNFKKYKMLRVLDLGECSNLCNKHLQKICNLLVLKYLSLGEGISKVPEKISKLQLLETLDLRKTNIDSVPVQVIQLPRLKHLMGKFQEIEGDRATRNLQLLLKESHLETLSGIVTGKSEELPQAVMHMKKLKKVKIWCKTTDSGTGELDRQHGEVIKKFIRGGNEEPSRSLSIDLQGMPQEFLDNLQAPGALASLKLRGNLGRFPLFIPQLNHIKELCLAFTKVCRGVILPEAETDSNFEMNTLRYLKLIEEDLGPLEIRHKHFPSLERICLVGVTSIKGIQTGDLEYLESLHMICATLDGLAGIQLGCFQTLKEIAILSTVGDAIKEQWQKEAMKHPRTPQVSIIPTPQCTVQGSGSSAEF